MNLLKIPCTAIAAEAVYGSINKTHLWKRLAMPFHIAVPIEIAYFFPHSRTLATFFLVEAMLDESK